MWLPAIIVEPPEREPLDTDDIVTFLRGVADDELGMVAGFAAAARAHVENYTGLRLVTQALTISCSDFTDLAYLPIGPIAKVDKLLALIGPAADKLHAAGGLPGLKTSVTDFIKRYAQDAYEDFKAAAEPLVLDAAHALAPQS